MDGWMDGWMEGGRAGVRGREISYLRGAPDVEEGSTTILGEPYVGGVLRHCSQHAIDAPSCHDAGAVFWRDKAETGGESAFLFP